MPWARNQRSAPQGSCTARSKKGSKIRDVRIHPLLPKGLLSNFIFQLPDLCPYPSKSTLPVEHHTAVFRHGRIAMHVHRYGHGPRQLLAFHGFGRTGIDFATLAPALAERCTIHAFDLPFHGQSPAPEGKQPMAPEEWTACIQAYMDHIGARKMDLMGYSLGGRMALLLLDRAPELLRQVFLLAPDGLVVSPWFRQMVRYRWGRALGRAFIRHPRPIHGLLNLLHRLRLVHDKLYRFLMEQTLTPEIRRLVYDVWDSTRLLEPDLARAAQNAVDRQIPVHLVLGEHDRVIKARYGQRLTRHAPGHVQVHLLPVGHRMLNAEMGRKLAVLWDMEGPGVP